jgi:hypothetical protein
MANTEKRTVGTYVDDFGNTYTNVPFKIGKQSKISIPFPLRDSSIKSICGARKYFNLRKAKVVFNDGFSIEIPIPNLADVKNVMNTYRSNPDIACVGLIGEKWRVVPPGILDGEYASTGLAGADKPPKAKFVYNYELDGGSSTIVRSVSIESLPAILLTAQSECLDKVTGGNSIACAVSEDFNPRMFKGFRINTATGGIFSRQIIVSTSKEEDILQCGKTVMTNFNCLGYQGQTMSNALEYYGSTPTP